MLERLRCAHCNKTGTCRNGENGAACAACAKPSRFSDYSGKPMGLICSVCAGRGTVEPYSLKLHNRFLPYFSMGFLVLLLVFLAWSMHFKDGDFFERVLGFVTTLIGSITAYYFGGKSFATVVSNRRPTPQPADQRAQQAAPAGSPVAGR